MLLTLGVCLVHPPARAENRETKAISVQYKIDFKSEHSLGNLSCYNYEERLRWQAFKIRNGNDLGPAKGTVTVAVPSGKKLGLNLNSWALSNPESLDKITPNFVEGLLLQAGVASDDETEDQRITKVIRHLGNFKHLKELFVDTSDVNDEQLVELPTLTSLERFSAFNVRPLVGTSLKRLSQLPNLHSICLSGTSFDGKNLALLKDFKKLESLDLAQTNLHGRLKYLTACPSLKQLYISSSNTTDDELNYLLQLKNLEILDLSHNMISDKGLQVLTGLKRLKSLDLTATSATRSGVISLAKDMHLARLLVPNRNFTPAEQQQLRDYCPDLTFGRPTQPKAPTNDAQHLFAPITRQGGS